MNLRGALGDMLFSFAFFFLMGIIGGGIGIGTSIFVGDGYDFRADDAALLGAKIESCVSEGFNLSSIKDVGDVGLLSEGCGLNNEVLKNYYKIRICEREDAKDVSDCVGLSTSESVFAFGDVTPCELKDSTKFLGCSKRLTNDYIIITATNQKLRRNAG